MSFIKKTASSHVLSCISTNNNTIRVRGSALYAEGSPSPYNAAEIQGVGDRVGKNLMPYPYVDFKDEKTITLNGITFTDNGDGSISVNGTATAVTGFYLANNSNLTIKPNTTYTLSGFDELNVSQADLRVSDNLTTAYMVHRENTSAVFQYSNTDKVYIQILIRNGTVCDNLKFKPKLEVGTVATKYAPYGEEEKYEIPIKISGKNLIPYPYFFTTKTINGVTFTDNGDGSITIDGTATANAVFYLVDKQDNYTLDKCGLKIGDSYTISKTLISGDSIANVYFLGNYYNTSYTMKQGALASSANTATSTIQSDFKSWGIYLLVAKDKTVNNTTIKLQLEKGSSATEYEPYYESVEKIITPSHPLYGRDGNFDNVNFKSGKALRNVFYKELTGNEKWQQSDKYINTYYATDIMNKRAPYGYRYCSHYKEVLAPDIEVDREEKVTGIVWDMIPLLIRDDNCKTVDEFKAFLKEQKDMGNPVTLVVTAANFDKPYTENIDMPILPTIDGTTKIKIDTKIVPENVDISFYQYQDEDGE